MGGKERGDKNKGVKIEEQAHGVPKFVIPLGLGLDEQEEEEEEEEALRKSSNILDSEETHSIIQY